LELRSYEEAFSNAEFAVIKNAGRFTFEEQPDDFAKIVSQFLSSME
jgi:pimeloyl-ACP methyl ester carboxylesterase